jgi:hypothetical protein
MGKEGKADETAACYYTRKSNICRSSIGFKRPVELPALPNISGCQDDGPLRRKLCRNISAD